MTARAKRLLGSLSRDSLQRLDRLSLWLKVSREDILERALKLFDEQYGRDKVSSPTMVDPLADPRTNAEFKRIMRIIGKRASDQLTPEERTARAASGAAGRNKSLTAAERTTIARAAARKRWEKNKKE